MYANCARCGDIARYLVDTDHETTEVRCDQHAEGDDVVETVNFKRNTLPLSTGGSGTVFKATCTDCQDKADALIRFEDGLGVITTEARCERHIPDDIQTRHDIENVTIKAQDVDI